MRIWDEGPLCERIATYRTMSEFFEGRETFYCTRHARVIADMYPELKVTRL